MSDLPDLPHIEKGIYTHYKGNRYDVIGVACHTETHEAVVVYRPLYDSTAELFVRPYDMFVETITIDGQIIPRFKKVED